MADSTKDKMANAGQAAADGAKNAGQGMKPAKEWTPNKMGAGGPKDGASAGAAGIKERMEVIASCGTKIGVVDHVEGGAIKLTRNDSPDGQHHFIPSDWVDHVDNSVHLKKNSAETERGWKSDAASCGACGG